MNSQKKIFLGIGIFWLVLIVGFIGVKEYTLRTGTEVLLKLRPVDPRDLFRGDYVILSYDISRIDVSAGDDFKEGDAIFVQLSLNGSAAAFSGYSKTKPSGGLYMTGKVTRSSVRSVQVKYGIESYFVPEGEGLRIERSLDTMHAKVAIDAEGRAVIKSLMEKGKEITFK